MADLKVKRRVLSACQTNCYYVYREGADEIAVIDPGDSGEIVYEDVKSLGFEKIAGILLTHGHGDHTGGALKLKELSGAKIYAHEDEAEILKDPEKNLSGWFGKAYGFEADEYFHDKQMTLKYAIRRDIRRAAAVFTLPRIKHCSAAIRFLTVLSEELIFILVRCGS